MVKPYLSIKLKDPQKYYLEDEIIHCIGNLKLDKVLKEATLRISFKGRSSSHSNNTRHHFETIFTTEKDISISKYNTSSHLKKMSQFEFDVQVPNGVTIPSYRYLEGSSEGGKIEYMIEATLETSGFLKRSVQATHIIQVPLIGKININENGLERTRESSIRWPKNEDNANTCVLSAWIPHEGCMRGKDVTIRVELKQPKRYAPAESVLFQLVRQELIASGRDSLPDMTTQIADKFVQSDTVKVELFPDISDNRLIGMSQVLVMSIPSNITPSIRENAKVMRLDYKIRVTTKIHGIDSGKDKDLSVNLPIVIGTTGVSAIYDSGFDSSISQLNQEVMNGSDGSNSVANGMYGANNYYGSGHGYYGPPPPMAGPGGFHMPDPMQRFPQPPQMYPPPPNRFVLNAQNLPYSPGDFNDKIEGMPVPTFSDSIIGYPPNAPGSEALSPSGILSEGELNPQAFVYPPVSRYSTPFSNPGSPLYPPPGNDTYRTLSPEEQNSTLDELTLALNDLSPVSSIKRQELKPITDSIIQGKPNTPTPPQTPGKPLVVDTPGWYDSSKDFTPQSCANATEFEEESDGAVGSFTRSTTMKKKSLVYRIDPLDSLTSYPPLMYKNNHQ